MCSLWLMIKKKKGILVFSIIYLTVLLNPLCWWARFVPQLQMLPCACCYYFRKNGIIFYILSALIIFNGYLTFKENYFSSAYKTYVMNEYYNHLYRISEQKQILIYKNNVAMNEDDETILERLKEYGVNYKLSNDLDNDFELIKTKATISKNYYIKY